MENVTRFGEGIEEMIRVTKVRLSFFFSGR